MREDNFGGSFPAGPRSYILTVFIPTCHVRTLYVCFPRSPKGFPSHDFYRNFCSACAVLFTLISSLERATVELLCSIQQGIVNETFCRYSEVAT